MEDRKRPAISGTDEIAPPSKRQAVNGATKSRDDGDHSKDEAFWIEEYQKGAIYRQMLEYRRQKATLENRLEEITKHSTYHDDHLRIVDQWWLQLLQEVELLAEGSVSAESPKDPIFPFSSALSFKDSQDFQDHLQDKSKAIKSKLEALFSQIAGSRDIKPAISELESQITQLLAAQKDLAVRLERTNAEKESLSEQLDTATLRYVKAEKKLDRAKSAQVHKLEQQSLAMSTSRPQITENKTDDKDHSVHDEALKLKFDELSAVHAKQKEQLAAAFAEIKSLQEENSSLKARNETVTDEDYSRTELFKQFKSQNEDLIKRVNHLEAVNKSLREEAEKLQSERSLYRDQVDREAHAIAAELEDQLHQKEQDLTRIRSTRDELSAALAIHKASQDQERTSLEHMKELVASQDDRIAGLELELQRLRPREDEAMPTPREDLESLSAAELISRYLKLEKDLELIKSEVPSLEKAYKKAVSLSQKKVMDFTALESRLNSLTAEKTKAEQKYFAVRRDTDNRTNEIRALRLQNSKSTDIISQLKEVEAQNKTLLANLEKQLAELKQSNVAIVEESKKLKASSAEALRQHDALKSQAVNLGNLVKSKDASYLASKEKAAASDVEVERLKVRLEHVQKERDRYLAKSQASSSEEEENLRKLLMCNVCNSNIKNAILKTCGHVFCNTCIENRLANRRRKCPSCGKAFDKMDVMQAHI